MELAQASKSEVSSLAAKSSEGPAAASPQVANEQKSGASNIKIDEERAVRLNRSYGYSKTLWKAIQRTVSVGDDGVVGKLTVNAFAKWQAQNGFTGKDIDGIVGPGTLAKMKALVPEVAAAAGPAAASKPAAAPAAAASQPAAAPAAGGAASAGSGKEITVDGTIKSQIDSLDGFKYHSSLDKLEGSFKTKANEVIDGLKAAGVSVNVSSTLRDSGRQWMFYIAKYHGERADVQTGIDYIKNNLGHTVTVKNAKAAASAFGLAGVVGRGGNSNHEKGLAVDFAPTGTLDVGTTLKIGSKDVTVVKGSNEAKGVIQSRLDTSLKNAGYTEFVWWHRDARSKDDVPHWSKTGG